MKSRLTHAVSILMIIIAIGWIWMLSQMQAAHDPEFHNSLNPYSVFAVMALGGFLKWSEGQKPDGKP